MTSLEAALQHLGLPADIALAGRWATLAGERTTIYVIESTWGAMFYVWCDAPDERGVECYADAVTAIEAGLRRARHPATQPPAVDQGGEH